MTIPCEAACERQNISTCLCSLTVKSTTENWARMACGNQAIEQRKSAAYCLKQRFIISDCFKWSSKIAPLWFKTENVLAEGVAVWNQTVVGTLIGIQNFPWKQRPYKSEKFLVVWFILLKSSGHSTLNEIKSSGPNPEDCSVNACHVILAIIFS